MKVLGDPALSSALNTWLRGPEEAEQRPAAAPIDEVSSAAAADSTAQSTDKGRDTAESLLDLDVWNGTPAASQQLSTAAPVPQSAANGNANPAQVWAEHIFQPLL